MNTSTGARCLLMGLLVAGLAACASEKPAPDTVPDSDGQTDKLSSDAAAALVTCRSEIDTIENVEPDARVAFAVDVCSGIWLQPACAKSFDTALDLASWERAGEIMRSCRDAYCPELSAELALCSATLDDPVSLLEPLDDPAGTDPLEAWSQFNRVIFMRDYKANPDDQFITDFPSMLLQLVIVAPPRSAP